MGVPKGVITPRQEAIVAAVLALLGYLLTRTRDFGGDDTAFATAVDAFLGGRGASMEVVHPHHPVYNLLVAGATWLCRGVGLHPLVLDVGAALSAVAAAGAVGLLVFMLRRAEFDDWTALLAGLVLGASGGMWQFATRMEVYTLAAAAVAAWLAVVGVASPRAIRAGLAGAAAILAHAVTGLLAVPTAWRLRRRPREAALAVLIAVVIAGSVLAGLLGIFLGAWTPAALLGIVAPRGAEEWLAKGSALGAWRTVVGLVTWGWYRTVPVWPAPFVLVADVCGWVACGGLGLLVLLGIRGAVRQRAPLATTALLGIAAFVPVWLLWDVGNVEHAVAAAPLLAVLAAVGAASLPRQAGRWGLGLVFLALVVANGLASAIPQARPENSRPLTIASFVAASVPADAVVLSIGTDPRVRLSLGYLSGRRVLDLTRAGDAARREGKSPEQAWRWWLGQAEAARSVWATPDVFDPASRGWIERYGIRPDALDELATTWRVGERRRLPGDEVVGPAGFSVTELVPRGRLDPYRSPATPR